MARRPPKITFTGVSRRGALAGAAALAALAGCDGEGVPDKPEEAGEPLDGITPNEDFYITSCCGTPAVDGATWALVFRTLGAERASLDLDALYALAGRDKEHTLECISASDVHRAIGNAVWTGLPLSELLDALGVVVPGAAIELKFTSADDFHTSIPIADLPAVWLVWRMNGEELPAEHGWPARLLVPGRYGMKNPKWILEIDMIDSHHEGYWEARGWSDEAVYLPNAFVTAPGRSSLVEAGAVTASGTAFAGSDRIVRVEVRIDGGDWTEATLDYAPGADIWVLWHLDLELEAGEHTLQARCHTASGGTSSDDTNATEPLEGYDGSMQINVEAV